MTTVVAASIVIALEAITLACGLAGIGCKFISRKLLLKARKHDEVRVLAESKLNSIADIVSNSLKNNAVSDDEFRLVLDEVGKYSEMKRQIRLKAHHAFAYAAVRMDQEEENFTHPAGSRRGPCRNGKSNGWRYTLEVSRSHPPFSEVPVQHSHC